MTPVRVLSEEPLGFHFIFSKDGCFPLGELRTNSKAMKWKESLRAQSRVDFGQPLFDDGYGPIGFFHMPQTVISSKNSLDH